MGCHTPQLEAGAPILSGPEAFRRLREWRHSLLHSWSVDSPVHDWRYAHAVKLSAFSLGMHAARASALALLCRCITRCALPRRYLLERLNLAAWHRKRKALPPDPRPYRLGCLIHVLIAGVRLGGYLFLLLPLPSNLHRINCRARIPTLHCHLGAHTSNQQVKRTGSTPAFIR